MNDGNRLAGRTALVTGGSRGIGAAVVRALAAAGARVMAVARGADALEAISAETGAEAMAGDVADAALVDRITRSGFGGGAPDILVHSAGAFSLAAAADTTLEDFDRAVAVNLRGAFLLVRAWLPAMMERGSGHIVSIGSVAGRQPLPGNVAYAASKYGLRGMHAVLDAELRGSGVRTTLIEPAATSTELWDRIDADGFDLPPREAMLEPADVADAVLYAVTRPAHVRVSNLFIGRG